MPILFCFQKLLSYGDRLDKNKVDDKEVRKEAACCRGDKRSHLPGKGWWRRKAVDWFRNGKTSWLTDRTPKGKSKISLGFLPQTTEVSAILALGSASSLNSGHTGLPGSTYPSQHAAWWHQHMHAAIFTKVDDVRAVTSNPTLHCYTLGFACLWRGSWVVSLKPWPCVHGDLYSFVWRAEVLGLENMEQLCKDYCFSLRYSNKSLYSLSSYTTIIQVLSCSLAQGPGLFCNNNNKKAGLLITCQKLRHFPSGMLQRTIVWDGGYWLGGYIQQWTKFRSCS